MAMTKKRIDYMLTRMTEVSMEMEFDEFDHLTSKQKMIWRKLTRAMDRVCEGVQEYMKQQNN